MALRTLGVRSVRADQRVEELFALLRSVSGLTELALNAPDLSALADREPFGAIRKLTLLDVPSDYPLAPLRRLFPALRQLALYTTDGCTSLDLVPFTGDRHCRLQVNTFASFPHLLGQDLLSPEQLTLNARGTT
jgi:hypothetical protein